MKVLAFALLAMFSTVAHVPAADAAGVRACKTASENALPARPGPSGSRPSAAPAAPPRPGTGSSAGCLTTDNTATGQKTGGEGSRKATCLRLLRSSPIAAAITYRAVASVPSTRPQLIRCRLCGGSNEVLREGRESTPGSGVRRNRERRHQDRPGGRRPRLDAATADDLPWKMLPYDSEAYAPHVEMLVSDPELSEAGETAQVIRRWMRSPESSAQDRYLILHADLETGEGRTILQPWLSEAAGLTLADLCGEWMDDLADLSEMAVEPPRPSTARPPSSHSRGQPRAATRAAAHR